MFGIFIDVTGRKQAEEDRELLAGEMSLGLETCFRSLPGSRNKSRRRIGAMIVSLGAVPPRREALAGNIARENELEREHHAQARRIHPLDGLEELLLETKTDQAMPKPGRSAETQ